MFHGLGNPAVLGGCGTLLEWNKSGVKQNINSYASCRPAPAICHNHTQPAHAFTAPVCHGWVTFQWPFLIAQYGHHINPRVRDELQWRIIFLHRHLQNRLLRNESGQVIHIGSLLPDWLHSENRCLPVWHIQVGARQINRANFHEGLWARPTPQGRFASDSYFLVHFDPGATWKLLKCHGRS